MRSIALQPEQVTATVIEGKILCHDVVAAGDAGRVRLSKGRILGPDDAVPLRAYGQQIHLLELEPVDLHEDAASLRLAQAVAGEGLELHGPVESQTHLRATHRGLLEVNAHALEELNELPDVSVFTAYDGQPVDRGKAVAATKVTPLAVPETTIGRAEEIACLHRPVVCVQPFNGGAVGVVVRERLTGAAREKFESAINMKVGWFGSPPPLIRYLPDDVDTIAGSIAELASDELAVLLAAGVNSTDPLDLTIQALEKLGARTERRGVPAHPGSTCWLMYLNELPVFGLALCGMFSRTTVLDLLLPRFLTGRRVSSEDLARLGHGGLLGKEMAFRFPAYAGKER